MHVEHRRERETRLVAVAFLKDVGRTFLHTSLVSFKVVQVVGLIEVVPTDLGILALIAPTVEIDVKRLAIHIIIGRQVTIVVGTRVGSLVPVERGLAVERLVIGETRVQ